MHWSPYKYVKVLKNCCGVTDYEIDRAIYLTITIKLSQGEREESILVIFEAASVEH